MDIRMGKMIDLVGQRFGRLLVLNRSESNSKSGNAMWVCRCDCGNITTVIGSKLRSHHTKSCGCLKMNEIANGHSRERVYRTWRGMHQRCYNPKHENYKWYGGKGISVCTEWHDFIAFREWALANGYTDELTIDRINPDENYSPDNCCWVDMKIQANNRTSNRVIEINGILYTVSQLADTFSLSYYTVINRLRLGWNIKRIIETPERSKSNYGTKL